MEYERLREALAAGATARECPRGGEAAALWALQLARRASEADELTAPEVAAIVTRLGRQSMSRQAAVGLLSRLSEKGWVHRIKHRKSPDAYSIMSAGEEHLVSTREVFLVDPARALQLVRKFESVLEKLKGAIRICDPYLDSRSLDFIGSARGASSIRVLTERVTDEGKVKRELKAVEKQVRARVEVRKARKGVLHDRYIIHDGGMLVLGASLNSFGLRQSFVSKAGSDVRDATSTFFDDRWASATPI